MGVRETSGSYGKDLRLKNSTIRPGKTAAFPIKFRVLCGWPPNREIDRYWRPTTVFLVDD